MKTGNCYTGSEQLLLYKHLDKFGLTKTSPEQLQEVAFELTRREKAGVKYLEQTSMLLPSLKANLLREIVHELVWVF